jgi:hypothetical protein
MADIIDQAQDYDAKNLQQALEVQQKIASNTPRLLPRGYCLSPICGEEFNGDMTRLFCGPACAEAHHRYSKL